jgi:hypothetical protein
MGWLFRIGGSVLVIYRPASGGLATRLKNCQALAILVEVGHQEKCNEFSHTGQYTRKLGAKSREGALTTRSGPLALAREWSCVDALFA